MKYKLIPIPEGGKDPVIIEADFAKIVPVTGRITHRFLFYRRRFFWSQRSATLIGCYSDQEYLGFRVVR